MLQTKIFTDQLLGLPLSEFSEIQYCGGFYAESAAAQGHVTAIFNIFQ
jgi:hypothetical protein